jgi:HD-GYP domain-containing protein (c-di-GMP phosphodiesterase class II)
MVRSVEKIKVSLLDMVLCLARAIDFLHMEISEHHLRVAYIASCLAEELGLGAQQVQDVMIAGALHDLAAVCSPAWARLLDDALLRDMPGRHPASGDMHRHGFEGYLMLRDFQPFSQAAGAIRFHHVDWDSGRGGELDGEAIPLASHILRLADQIAVMPDDAGNILEQAAAIRRTVAAGSGRLFHPDAVTAFEERSTRESFWLDMTSRHKEQILRHRYGQSTVVLELDDLHRLSGIFGRIIDYRSSFTATHSSGVAATSENLAAQLGMESEKRLIGVAGYLHDIGKLAVPAGILDKPGKLTQQEILIVKQHPYYTHQILSMVPGLEHVNTWASLHHERLDGTGYPFRPCAIPPGSRIIAVADVFTAITEDRPYRRGMNRSQCFAVLDKLVLERAIDGDIVTALRINFDEIHQVRRLSQQFNHSKYPVFSSQ